MTPDERIHLERLAAHLCRLGPRAVAEALVELADHGDLTRLDAYRRLSPEMLAAVGADQFPPAVCEVPR